MSHLLHQRVLLGVLVSGAVGIQATPAAAAECLVNFDDPGALSRYSDLAGLQRTDFAGGGSPIDYQQVCSDRIVRLDAQKYNHLHLGHEDPDIGHYYEDYFGPGQDLNCTCFADDGSFGRLSGCYASGNSNVACQAVDHVNEPRVAFTHGYDEMTIVHVPFTSDGTEIDGVCTPDGCVSTAGETFRLRRITLDGPNMNIIFVKLGLQRLRVSQDPPIYVTIPQPQSVTYSNLAPGTYDFTSVGLVERAFLVGSPGPVYTIEEVLIDTEPQVAVSGVELEWHDDFGNPIPQSFQYKSEGEFSSEITSSGWSLVSTPDFDTRTLTRLGDAVAFDVRVPSEQSNPYWLGDVQLFANIPSAGIYNQFIGYQALSDLEQDAWRTVRFDLPSEVYDALAGDHPDAQFTITSNLASDLEPLRLDHLRFTGDMHILPRCGDGFTIGDEQCDDGNLEPGDGCSNLCQLETADTCGLHNAVDLGTVNSVADLPADACLKVSEYPGSWVNALELQRQAGPADPLPYTWSNCIGAGVGSLDSDWQQDSLRSVSSSCETLIEFLGSPSDVVRLSWWANG